MKPNAALGSLCRVFAQITDPRGRKGTQHPYAGIVALVFLGLLCRIREMVSLQRWAESHWDLLKEPLGFKSDRPPHATTISRALAKLSLAELRDAFSTWIKIALQSADSSVDPPHDPSWIAAVDGKTSKQGLDAEGNPVHMLNVFLQEIKVAIDQWSVGGEKTNEPTLLARRVEELLHTFPMLTLLTGDAIFLQRPLLKVLKGHNCEYLFQVKANQAELLEALQTTFADAAERPPHHEIVEKKGEIPKSAGFGPTWTTPSICVNL
jgi:hypothetical protein